jgi:hypothetical protein
MQRSYSSFSEKVLLQHGVDWEAMLAAYKDRLLVISGSKCWIYLSRNGETSSRTPC